MPNDPLNDLEKRLEAAQKEYEKDYNPKPEKDGESINVGARAGIELVGGMLGGGLIGFLLDKAFDTSPILFLLFLILGVFTGFYNIYKITNNLGTNVGLKGLHGDKKDATQSPDFKNQKED